jgi:hypothetical protein
MEQSHSNRPQHNGETTLIRTDDLLKVRREATDGLVVSSNERLHQDDLPPKYTLSAPLAQ